nr:zinc finger, CCHC-type [Tanacetum cinerariifolium]
LIIFDPGNKTCATAKKDPEGKFLMYELTLLGSKIGLASFSKPLGSMYSSTLKQSNDIIAKRITSLEKEVMDFVYGYVTTVLAAEADYYPELFVVNYNFDIAPYELYESLKKKHVGEEKVQQERLQSLMIGFQTLQMKEDDTVDAFTAKLNGYATKAKELGNTLDESLLVRKLLDSTPDRNKHDSKEEGSTHKEKSNTKWNKREWDMSKIQCHKYGKLGHFRKNCKESSTSQEQSNLILEDNEPSLLMATHEGEHKEVLLNEGQIQPEKYATAEASIKGKGSILLGCKNNEQKIVSDVYFIPNIKSNIISLGQLNEIGCKIIMDGNKLTLYDKNKKLLIKVERSKNRLYSTRLQIEAPICLLANIDNQAWLWHARLGHLNFDDINKMTRKGVDNENATLVNTKINDNITYQEHDPITDHDSPVTPPAYTYNPNSKEEEEATISLLRNSGDRFDDTLVRGFKDLTKIYQNAREVETKTLLFTKEEPRNYNEASTDKKWIDSMEIELESIKKNNTWTLTTLPINHKTIGLKWFYKAKRDAKGKIIKYKARLVAKGYVQEQGIDFDEVFALVARIETVRLMLALAAYHGWQVHHLDVKSAFLHRDLKKEVYVTQPEGFIQQGNSGKVYKLTKALYGRSKTSILIVGVNVDDLIITGTPRKELEVFKSQMEDKFEMSDLGLLAYYLGIEVTQKGGEITIKQTGYINKILKETNMMDSNDMKIPVDPGTKLVKAEDGNSVDATHYRSLIGSLRYLLHTRPDLSYSVRLLSRFMQDPKDHHLKAVKQKQPAVALSSCESEFMAATEAACQALWLKRLLSELTGWEEEIITLKVDNISAIALVRNPVFHRRSKHVDIRYHFIRECVENGHINVEHDEATIKIKEENVNYNLDIASYTQFDLRPYIESPNWIEINAGIQQHLQKAYNTNKAAFKAQHWVIDPTTGTYKVKKIRRERPEYITASEWDKYIEFWNDPRNIARAAQNRQNRAKSTVISRQRSRSLARLRDEMTSTTQEYPSLIDTFFVAHTVNGEFLRDEDRRIYEEMRRLEAMGTYTHDKINRLARGATSNKQEPNTSNKTLPMHSGCGSSFGRPGTRTTTKPPRTTTSARAVKNPSISFTYCR